VGDNPSSIDEHASLIPIAAIATPAAESWRKGLRLEAVANLAHELRTPVQVLIGYVDILRDDHGPEFSTETHTLLDRMNANVHDLAQTIDNLMHFVLSEINAEAMIDEDVTPGGLVAEITPVLEAANQQKQLKLELDFASAPDLFRVPRRPLKAILLNLAVNAIKFTDSGSVTVALRRPHGSAPPQCDRNRGQRHPSGPQPGSPQASERTLCAVVQHQRAPLPRRGTGTRGRAAQR
jgi:signal transduction histidine kinase